MSRDHDEHKIKAPEEAHNPLSSEIVLDCVFETILRMTLTCTGATGVQILMPGRDELQPRARAQMQDDHSIHFGGTAENELLVRMIAHDVMRTGKAVTIDTANDASTLFAASGSPVRLAWSVICLPLFCGRQVIAALYLEHDRVNGAFSAEKRALAEMLAVQIAIALKNTRISQARYDEIQRKCLAGCHGGRSELSRCAEFAAVGEIVGSIVHEMSQPLSAIDSSSGAALRWLQRETPDLKEATLSLTKVQTCTARAREIIDRLRVLSRQARVPFEVFDVHAAIREAVLQSRLRIENAGATVAFAGMHSKKLILGNRMQIQQVIEFLIANSLDAMSSVTDRPRRIKISSAKAVDAAVVISISDSGPGRSSDWEEKLLRPSFTKKAQDIGMGLAISKRIIEAHGGKIWVRKVDPLGVQFSFSLAPV
jgi:C4-dicarboxylate-specific signal transduction histidine kinase